MMGAMVTTYLLVGALVATVATAAVASHKGRNAVLWGALGFFFGLIALIVCALLPSRKSAPSF
jgi:hypothetical protein